jgi:hypothetical protein
MPPTRTSCVATYLSDVFLIGNFEGGVYVGRQMEDLDHGGSAVISSGRVG